MRNPPFSQRFASRTLRLSLAAAVLAVAAATSRASTLEMDPLVYSAKNWSGYAAETSFGSPASDSVTAVAGTWIVPAVTPSANPAASAAGQLSDCVVWVGIDGFSDSTVEQIGTESEIESGVTTYHAWYEMYPAGMVEIPSLTIKPGDSIAASVQYNVASHPNEFQLSILDQSTSKSYTIYENTSTPSRSSAEWIVEAPTSGTILPLPTFGSEPFTSATATINSTTGPIDDSAWQAAQINLNDPTWGDVLTTSALADVTAGSGAASNFGVVQVPEPSALVLLAVAAAFSILRSVRRTRKK